MKKLKLNLDEIKVESFEVSREQDQLGTVLAAQTGDGCDTEQNSCSLCGAPTSVAAGCSWTQAVNCTHGTCDGYTCRPEDPC
jgi:hypothetical protein